MWTQKGEDKGIWTERVNEITGQSSLREHKPKVVWKSCKKDNHSFSITGNRELTCTKCDIIRTFLPHRDKKLLESIS